MKEESFLTHLAPWSWRPDYPHDLAVLRRINQEVDRIAVRQSGKLWRVKVLLRQRGLRLADERLHALDERHDSDVEDEVTDVHLQVGDGGHEAVVGVGHVVLHVHHLLLVDVDLKECVQNMFSLNRTFCRIRTCIVGVHWPLETTTLKFDQI